MTMHLMLGGLDHLTSCCVWKFMVLVVF